MTPGALLGGKYRLTRRLGIGAMGSVWAAVNQDTGREVALKLIHHSTDELRQRLRREARAIGKLQHRNIIEIYDVSETDEGDPFLIMPLLNGETLSARLTRERRLPQDVAALLARDVARALSVAHEAGVIHRDLKPENIFLHLEAGTEGPIVKVLDFGVSKSPGLAETTLTATGGLVGSPAYMSPEQARAERDIDPRADLWSLGVILFEMLAGERPFKGGTHQLLPQIVYGDIPSLAAVAPEVSPALVELTARCLVRDRAQRIGSAAEMAVALQRCLGRPATFTGDAVAPPAAPSGDDFDESNALTVKLGDHLAVALRERLAEIDPPTAKIARDAFGELTVPIQQSGPPASAPRLVQGGTLRLPDGFGHQLPPPSFGRPPAMAPDLPDDLTLIANMRARRRLGLAVLIGVLVGLLGLLLLASR